MESIREHRVPHAQFIVGPRGSGVLPLALAYATYLFCENPGEEDSCGVCQPCTMMAKLAHPDLNVAFPIFFQKDKPRTNDYYLEDWRAAALEDPYMDEVVWRERIKGEAKQLQMGVAIAAEMLRKLSLKSFMGGWKVMLIWLPELMRTDMANKILKALEEPEPRTAFLLVGHDAGNILPTIISRTQLVKVEAIEVDVLAEVLQHRYAELPPEEARSIAARSEGNLLKANAMAQGKGTRYFGFVHKWLRACYTGDVAQYMALADEFSAFHREEQKSLLQYSLYLIRQCTLYWKGLNELLVVEGEEREFAANFSKLLNSGVVRGMHRELEEAYANMARQANQKILFMDLSYRMDALISRARPVAR